MQFELCVMECIYRDTRQPFYGESLRDPQDQDQEAPKMQAQEHLWNSRWL